jgi:hypothetical protein
MESREIRVRCESEFEARRVDCKLARLATRGCV